MVMVLIALAVYAPVAIVSWKDQPRTALWYMANGPALQAKLNDCRTRISAQNDANCRAASHAFMTIMTVDAQQKAAPNPRGISTHQ